jgi:hypothetical protein
MESENQEQIIPLIDKPSTFQDRICKLYDTHKPKAIVTPESQRILRELGPYFMESAYEVEEGGHTLRINGYTPNQNIATTALEQHFGTDFIFHPIHKKLENIEAELEIKKEVADVGAIYRIAPLDDLQLSDPYIHLLNANVEDRPFLSACLDMLEEESANWFGEGFDTNNLPTSPFIPTRVITAKAQELGLESKIPLYIDSADKLDDTLRWLYSEEAS